jgi:hypothetical protein
MGIGQSLEKLQRAAHEPYRIRSPSTSVNRTKRLTGHGRDETAGADRRELPPA